MKLQTISTAFSCNFPVLQHHLCHQEVSHPPTLPPNHDTSVQSYTVLPFFCFSTHRCCFLTVCAIMLGYIYQLVCGIFILLLCCTVFAIRGIQYCVTLNYVYILLLPNICPPPNHFLYVPHMDIILRVCSEEETSQM